MSASTTISEDGLVSGYASLFGITDLNGDVVMPGAFKASLNRRATREVKFLFQHDPREPIGIWLDAREDGTGLRVTGQLISGIAKARDAYAMIKAGAIDGLSIGFKTERAARPHRGRRQLLKLDLWEISLVTFPMLPGARLAAPRNEAAQLAQFYRQVTHCFQTNPRIDS